MMDARAEFQKVWKDVTASAKEFAALGLSYSTKALELAGQKIKKAEDSLKAQAEKLAAEKDAKPGNGETAKVEIKETAAAPPSDAAK